MNNESVDSIHGRITHVVQAFSDLAGWVTCRYAASTPEARQKAMELAEDDAAWMPATRDLTVRQRRDGFVRIVAPDVLERGLVREEIERHNREMDSQGARI